MPERTLAYVPLADLQADPKNPKAHRPQVIGESIERFGYIESIVRDDRTGYIISGHGRTKALQAMEANGEAPPDGIRLGEGGVWLAPVLTGWASRSDAEARAALIALNQTTILGGWNDRALLDLLTDLDAMEDGLVGVGFDTDDIEALREQLEALDAPAPDHGGDRGGLIDVVDLSLGTPDHETHHGDHWIIDGKHHLVVCNPHTEHALFTGLLTEGTLLAPYPDVWLPLSEAADQYALVMVQPQTYLAGHTLDNYANTHPDAVIEKAS